MHNHITQAAKRAHADSLTSLTYDAWLEIMKARGYYWSAV